MATVVGKAALDAWLANPSGSNYGNGSGPRLRVGYAPAFGSNRVVLAIPLTGTGGALEGVNKPISQALLGLRVKGAGGCTSQGGSPRFWVEQLTSLITENSNSDDCTVSGAGASTGRWPGPSSTTTNRVKYDANPSADSWISIDITAMVEAARLAGTAILYLRLIAADTGSGYDEGSSGRGIAFYSRNTSGSEPKITVTWNPNTAPTAPTVAPAGGPAGGTPVVTNPGTSLAVTVTPNDPDVGDSMTGAKLQVYPDGTTQAQIDAGTAPTPQTVTWTQTAAPFPTSKVLTATGLVGNTKYLYRAQTRDKGNGSSDQSTWEWGAWTALQYVQTNTVPGTISNLNVETDTLTPDITGLLSDADPGATINRVRLVVERPNGDGSYTSMLDAWFSGSGVTGGTAFLATYNGSPLSWGTQYRINGQIEDNLAQAGPLLSSPVYWTPVQVLGPDNMSPRTTASVVGTRSPTLTIGHSAAFDQYELEVANSIAGAGGLAADVGVTGIASTTSAAIAWPGASPLPWSARPSWRAKVRITATTNWTDWSPWFPFAVNALPETGVFYVKDQFGAWVLLSTITAKVAANVTPELSFAYVDPDRETYGEVPKWRDIEVRAQSGDALRARIIRRMYAAEDETRAAWLHPFDSPGGLTPANSGWTAGTAAALSYDSAQKVVGSHSLKIALTNQVTGTVSINTGPPTVLGTLYTDLSGITTCKVRVRASALPAGLFVTIRFEFVAAAYAEFNVVPAAANTWEQKTITLASPTASSGTIDWASVSAIKVRVGHAAGSDQSFDVWLDDLYADLYASGSTYKIKGRYADNNTEDAWGAQSHADQYALLKTSTPPVVAQSGSVAITDPTPDLAWTVSSGGPQVRRRVVVEELPGYRDVVYYSSGCVADWRLGETAGTAAVDRIAARNGVYTGGYTLNQPGALMPLDSDPGVALNGSSGYVTVPYAAALHPGDVFTLEMSIKRTAIGTLMTLYSAGANDVAVYLGEMNELLVYKQNVNPVWISPANFITDTTTWHHLIISRAGTGLTTVYLDGVLVAPLGPTYRDTVLAMEPTSYWRLDDGYSALVRSMNPISYWRLGEATPGTGTAVDEMGVNNGTYVGSPTSVPGLLSGDANTGVVFNGTTQRVSQAALTTAAMTLAVWFRRTRTLTSETLLGSVVNGARLGFGSLDNFLILDKPAVATLLRATVGVADTAIHLVVVTWTGTVGSARLYLDGVDVTTTLNTAQPDAGKAVAIAAQADATSYFAGTLDEPAIWDRALSAAEVLALFRAGDSPYRRAVMATAPVGYWRLGEASGTVAVDEMGANNGTYVGAPTLGAAGLLTGDPDTAVALTGTQYAKATVGAVGDGVGAFSIAIWADHVNNPATFERLLEKSSAAGGWDLWLNATEAYFRRIDSGGSHDDLACGGITSGRHFLVATYDGATMRAYVDGVANGAPVASSRSLSATTELVIGAQYNYANKITGTLDEPAIWDRALSAAEITALYAARINAYPPTVAVDEMGLNPGTYVGSRVAKGVTGALAADTNRAVTLGANQYASAASMALPAAITLGAWVNVAAWTGDKAIVGEFDSVPRGIMLYLWGGTPQLRLYMTEAAYVAAPSLPSTGAWHFVVGTHDGTNGRLYIDGVLVAGPTALPPIVATNGSFDIGAYHYGTFGRGVGSIDEAFVFPRALTATEVASLYAARRAYSGSPLAIVAHGSSAINIGRRVGDNDRFLAATVDEISLYNRALSDGEAIAHFAARLRDPSPQQVHESLEAETTVLTYKVPGGILNNARAYRATVEVTNEDDLTGSLVI